MTALFANPKGPFHATARRRLFGVYPATVTDLVDEDDQGRVEVEFPWLAEDAAPKTRVWARLSTLMAGPERGTWFIPEVDDEVLVAFVAGDPRWPVVVGSLWNGVDAPPETMDPAGENHIRSITSEAKHKLTFDDTPSKEHVRIKTQKGHQLFLDDEGEGTVTLEHVNGSSVVIEGDGTIRITSVKDGQVVVKAAKKVLVQTPEVTVESPKTTFTGVVEAPLVKAGFVESGGYNNALGNLI